MRYCNVCDSLLGTGESHLDLHGVTHELCVCCKQLVLKRNIVNHERECKGFQRFRPIIQDYENRMIAARSSSLESRVLCFCGESFTNQSIAKHRAKTACEKRYCRVCDIIIGSMLVCEEHRCVCIFGSFYEIYLGIPYCLMEFISLIFVYSDQTCSTATISMIYMTSCYAPQTHCHNYQQLHHGVS